MTLTKILPALLACPLLFASAGASFAESTHLYIIDRIGFLISAAEVVCKDAPEEYDKDVLAFIAHTSFEPEKSAQFQEEYLTDRKRYTEAAQTDPSFAGKDEKWIASYCARVRKDRDSALKQVRALDAPRAPAARSTSSPASRRRAR